MAEQKTLTPEEKTKVMPLMQGAMQTYEQRYGMKLTEAETNRVVSRAFDNINSTSNREVRDAVKDQMFALLIEKDPVRAIDLRMQVQNVAQSERERIHGVAEGQGFKAANREIAKLESGPEERAPEPAFRRLAAKAAAQKPGAGEAEVAANRKEPERSAGLTQEEMARKMFKVAESRNNQILNELGALEDANKKAAIVEKNDKEYQKAVEEFKKAFPEKKYASDRQMMAYINAHPMLSKYEKEKSERSEACLERLNVLKKERDAALESAFKYAGADKETIAEVEKQTTFTGNLLAFYVPGSLASIGQAEANSNHIATLIDGLKKPRKKGEA